MELVLKQIPFALLTGELVVSDRTPAEQFKLRLLQEIFRDHKLRLIGSSELGRSEWLYDGALSAAFTVGLLVRHASWNRIEGPLVAQLSAGDSTFTLDETYARASFRLKFTEDSAGGEDAMMVREDMVCYRQGHLTWILGGTLERSEQISAAALELGAVAAVAVALGASAKEVAAGLRRFRQSPLALLERQISVEVAR